MAKYGLQIRRGLRRREKLHEVRRLGGEQQPGQGENNGENEGNRRLPIAVAVGIGARRGGDHQRRRRDADDGVYRETRSEHSATIEARPCLGPERLPDGRRDRQAVNSKRGISPDAALPLSRALGPSAAFWLNLQSQYDPARTEKLRGAKIRAEVEPAEQETYSAALRLAPFFASTGLR